MSGVPELSSTPHQAVEHLIRETVAFGYAAALLGVPIDRAVEDAVEAAQLNVIPRTIAVVRQVGQS